MFNLFVFFEENLKMEVKVDTNENIEMCTFDTKEKFNMSALIDPKVMRKISHRHHSVVS